MTFGRILLTVFRPLVWLLFPYRVIGRENIPQGGKVILCCNHISLYDPILLLLGQKRPIYFMAKDELFHIPVVGWCIRNLFGAFPVKRGKGDQSALTAARAIVEQEKMMGIFIEGTRSRDGRLGTAKSGAALITAQTGADVLPCGVVCKDQKVRLFRRTTLVIGTPLTPEELHLTDPEKPELRYASRTMMEHIAALMKSVGYLPPAEEAAS